MFKQNGINKSLLSTENIVNSSDYENFAMQLLNRKNKGTNVIALTCDIKTSDITAIVCLNVGFNLKKHGNNVLVINMDTHNIAFNDLLESQSNDDRVVSYGDIDVLLPQSTDFTQNLSLEDFKSKYSQYDFVILCVPSPKYESNYLAVPKNTDFYLFFTKFFSSYFAVNKCIDLIEAIDSKVLGSVYIKLK